LWAFLTVDAVTSSPVVSSQAAVSTPGQFIRVDARPVALHPKDPSVVALGDFFYAGGLVLSSRDTNRLHELSDLVISGADRLTAVGDDGIFFEARLLFDDRGRLTGITDGRITPMLDMSGKALTGRAGDAEGLTMLPGGDLLVSFEREPRIWLYPSTGRRPRAVASPDARFPSNEGMEALDAMPDVGADAYMVGAEASGETWTCRLTAGCAKAATLQKPKEFGLVSLNRLPDGKTAYLLRAYDPARGPRVSLRILESTKLFDRMEMARPLTVDNFEGLASTPTRNGSRRFYLISDDNAASDQRTLLLAFDWRPKAPER
jgi:hypothetical protein